MTTFFFSETPDRKTTQQVYISVSLNQVYSFSSTNIISVIVTVKKPAIDTQKLERKECKHTAKENHQTIREETKRKSEQRRTIKQLENN